MKKPARSIAMCLSVFAALAMAGCPYQDYEVHDGARYEETFDFNSGGKLTIDNIAGIITITGKEAEITGPDGEGEGDGETARDTVGGGGAALILSVETGNIRVTGR